MDHGAFENACLAPIPQLATHRLAVQSNAVLSPGKWTRLVFRVQLLDRAQGYRCHPLLFCERVGRCLRAPAALPVLLGDRMPPTRPRPEERRVGEEVVSTCKSRWEP